jgi:putative oxidoreductase
MTMEKHIGKFAPYAYAALRIVAGLLFATHGAQKVFGAFGGTAVPLMSQAGAAGVIELVCGLCIALGVLTGWMAFLASGEMAVAYFQVHAPNGVWPVMNRGELSVLYCFLFLYIATRGTVRFGVMK